MLIADDPDVANAIARAANSEMTKAILTRKTELNPHQPLGSTSEQRRSNGMTFGETLEFLRGLRGKLVEVQVGWPTGEEAVEIAGFGGIVDRLDPTPSSSTTRWRLWLGVDPLVVGNPTLVLDENLFESAEVVADAPPAEERSSSGITWTLLIRQGGLIVDVLVYA
jgi:hypothetical protein